MLHISHFIKMLDGEVSETDLQKSRNMIWSCIKKAEE